MNRRTLHLRSGVSGDCLRDTLREWVGNHIKTAPRRCANTVAPRGLADWIGVDS